MIGVLHALGVMAVAEVQTYRVPCRYSAELAADRRVIAEREAAIDGLEGEMARLRQERETDAATFKNAVQNLKLEYEQEMAPYSIRLTQVGELVRQRKAQLEAELARIPLNANDPPPLYNAKVFRRNEARDRCQRDLREAATALRTLGEEMTLRTTAHRTKLQTIEKAYREASAARTVDYNARRGAYESQVRALNQFIASYNGKLERYGTPVPEPVVDGGYVY